MEAERANKIHTYQQRSEDNLKKAEKLRQAPSKPIDKLVRKTDLQRFDDLLARVSGLLESDDKTRGTKFTPEVMVGQVALRLSIFKGGAAYELANSSSIGAYWPEIGVTEHVRRIQFIGHTKTEGEVQRRAESVEALSGIENSVVEYEKHKAGDSNPNSSL